MRRNGIMKGVIVSRRENVIGELPVKFAKLSECLHCDTLFFNVQFWKTLFRILLSF